MNTLINRLAILVLFIAFSTLSVTAQKTTMWEADKDHTSVNFSINHFFSSVTGKFTDFEDDICFDRENLADSKIFFTISVNSINTENQKRDKHLKSDDFFDVETYPTIKFESNRFEKLSENEYAIHGKLTIKDITRDVVVPMKITGEMEHPMMEGTIILGMLIDTTLDRTDYEVGSGDWASTLVVGDEVRIHIPMELNRMK